MLSVRNPYTVNAYGVALFKGLEQIRMENVHLYRLLIVTGRKQGMMEKVVTEGTGIRGKSDFVTSAGKTGTAETGQRNSDDLPIVQSWFVGYFPTNYPRYVVTVFAEDAQNSGADTAKAFCEISNKLMLKQGNG